MKLKKEEILLQGNWEFRGSSVKNDKISDRIDWLISKFLILIKTDSSGWNQLYQDPDDKRYWELTYPSSDMHGGGAPQLMYLSEQEAIYKYKI